ncbi:hypothetical protein VYA_05190 [Vibrio alfacsensis]|nr:hypothetical protein VYA_05190 [Vibrio alfacsensis]
MLEWAALLHEVGLSISLRGFHRHSFYILLHSNLPGFNREQQLLLATLARFQRKSLKLNELPEFNLYKQTDIINLIKVLRLSIVVNGQRSEEPLPELTLSVLDDEWRLTCSEDNWLEQNKLLGADLEEEQLRWNNVGWQLTF